ncbi:hypothetical protein SESBI_17011 [Sesbania bispinosa]|nr:hypothetical protein SESBI_17011 [Sesbania bispinosa]
MSNLLVEVAFLRNQAPIDCGFLLENEDLPARLRQSLDKMPPKVEVPRVLVDEKAMRRWLKKAGGDPEQTGATAQPSTQPSASASLPPVLNDKWWALFNNFECPDGGEVNSIFDRRFLVDQIIAREFNKKEDWSWVNKVGMRNVGKQLMSMGMQTAFFGYYFDSGMNSMDKELKDWAQKIVELSEKVKANESSSQTIATLQQNLLDAQTKSSLEAKAKTDIDLEALQKEIALQHAHGFHKAIAQIQCLDPDVITEGVGVFKRIVEGKLVDESDDDEE